jgi:hypothetical protein
MRRRAAALAVLLVLPGTAAAEARLGVRVGSHADHGRVVVDARGRLDYQVEQEAGRVTLRFAAPGGLDLPGAAPAAAERHGARGGGGRPLHQRYPPACGCGIPAGQPDRGGPARPRSGRGAGASGRAAITARRHGPPPAVAPAPASTRPHARPHRPAAGARRPPRAGRLSRSRAPPWSSRRQPGRAPRCCAGDRAGWSCSTPRWRRTWPRCAPIHASPRRSSP